MPVKYVLFLDESGQRDYDPKTDNHFVVAGPIVRLADVASYEVELRGLKRAFFRDADVEIKSHWLRQPDKRAKHYFSAYNIDEALLTSCVEAIYRWIAAASLVFVAGVVDKRQMTEKYSNPHFPGGVAYNLVLQRFQKYLAKRRCNGKVIFDQISGATKARNQWQDLLKKQHARLLRNGCPYTKSTFSNIASTISFADSAQWSLLQVADLAAYNTLRQFRCFSKEWDDSTANELPLYEYFSRLLSRFDQDGNGVFAGFGVAKMPAIASNRWLAK